MTSEEKNKRIAEGMGYEQVYFSTDGSFQYLDPETGLIALDDFNPCESIADAIKSADNLFDNWMLVKVGNSGVYMFNGVKDKKSYTTESETAPMAIVNAALKTREAK